MRAQEESGFAPGYSVSRMAMVFVAEEEGSILLGPEGRPGLGEGRSERSGSELAAVGEAEGS